MKTPKLVHQKTPEEEITVKTVYDLVREKWGGYMGYKWKGEARLPSNRCSVGTFYFVPDVAPEKLDPDTGGENKDE